MIVRVERCRRGGDRYCFLLTFPQGGRESICGEVWNRKAAAEALDVAEKLYGLKRKNVRFKVR